MRTEPGRPGFAPLTDADGASPGAPAGEPPPAVCADRLDRPDRPGRRRAPWWTLFGVVAAAALVLGSGVLASSPPTAAQRAAAIEAGLRCPSCQDLSVAQSDAPTAMAVRAVVRHQVAEGRTDQQIRSYLVSRYGSSIVLVPPASGWTLLLWVPPLVAGVAALAFVLAVLVRRHRESARGLVRQGGRGPLATAGSRAAAGTGGEPPERLAEQRAFLVRSLADADAEYLAGDLSDRDYLALRRRDMERLAALDPRAAVTAAPPRADGPTAAPDADRAPATAGATGSPDAATVASRSAAARRRHRRSWWYLAGAAVAFAAALAVAVTQSSSGRLPGQTPTGGASLSPQQQLDQTLAQAATEEDDGQVAAAAALYGRVLAAHPGNEVALAQLGWIEFETGHPTGDRALLADARAKLDRAVRLDPGDYAAHLYLGTLLFQLDGDPAAAVDQFRLFLGEHPPPSLVAQAAPVISRAFADSGIAPPAGLSTG